MTTLDASAGVDFTGAVIIIGAGGFGRECLDVLKAMNSATTATLRFRGFIDPSPESELLGQVGAMWLGGDEVLTDHAGSRYIVGVGDPARRRKLADQADAAGLIPITLIHPSATIGADVHVGPGSVICSHVSITTHVRIGKHTHINLNSTVGHDSIIGDFVSINPGATVSGNVTLDDDVLVGTNSAILQGLHVGRRAVVGAGAAVVKNVAPDLVVVGVPARALGQTRGNA